MGACKRVNRKLIVFVFELISVMVIADVIEERTIAKVNEIQERNINEIFDLNKLPSEIEITVLEDVHHLKLVKSQPIFAPNLMEGIISMDDNDKPTIKQTNGVQDHQDIDDHLFTDETGQASLHIKKMDGMLYMEGIIKHGIRIENEVSDETKEPIHVVYKHLPNNDTLDNVTEFPTNFLDSKELPETIIETRTVNDQPNKPDNRQYTVEVFVVVDNMISKYFIKYCKDLKEYLGVFFNTVNRRFANIRSLNIQIVITHIMTLENIERENLFIVELCDGVLDESETLADFGLFINVLTEEETLPRFDVAVWLTGMNLGSKIGRKIYAQDEGMAYIRGACKIRDGQNYNVALIKDGPGTYHGIHSAVHELGHLLGAIHDGENSINNKYPGAEQCLSDDGFIMNSKGINRMINSYKFSPCSIRQFSFFLCTEESSCLRDKPINEAINLIDKLPGQSISLNKQCRRKLSNDLAVFCEKQAYEVCKKLWCRIGQEQKRTSSGPALEGSPCGDNNICIEGKCVSPTIRNKNKM